MNTKCKLKRHLFIPRYFRAGGSPEHVIQLLSENYSAVAQTVNLLAEWLIQMGRYQNKMGCNTI